MTIQELQNKATAVQENISRVIIGKEDKIELVLCALLSGGHVLLEDVPGTGKTMLARSLAKSIKANFKRIQFTPDLLPQDLIGINYYNQKEGDFVFREGAIFTNILLADEINRATPRTQSALLECMEEHQVTADGVTRKLADPFFVIATQNPIETGGTYPLPEAQLDRFLMRLSLGYTATEQTVDILEKYITGEPLAEIKAVVSQEELLDMQQAVKSVYVHPDLLKYAAQVVEATRREASVAIGVSTRGNLGLVRAAQALAAMRGRSFVTPEDLKELAEPVLAHRIILQGALKLRSGQVEQLVRDIVEKINVPTEAWEKK